MTLFRFFKPWRRRKATLQDLVGDRLLSAARFRAAIYRERLRSDRTGGMFSFVRFDLNDDNRAHVRQLIELLDRRLRLTDEMGLWNEDVAILLPETPREGAQLLAQSICAQFDPAQPLQWVATSYPVTISTRADADLAEACDGPATPHEPIFQTRRARCHAAFHTTVAVVEAPV